MAPYCFIYAFGFALLLPPISSRGLVMLPIAYATVFAPLLFLSAGYFESMGLRWYHMIPTALCVFCYIPITQLGINLARQLRSKNFGAVTRSLGLCSVFSVAMVCIAFIPIKAIQPLILLVSLYVVAYMTRELMGAVTNNPMDRSGGSAAS
jgi:hypothetical protein